ncbi:MAG: hypothetical protein SOX82_03510 [Eubacteriales bacterium]|nr:hypothetical protein [Eubacteriales bacterium]MDY4212743.1 hypothetical protein [Eubacteriales bacterium]
MKKRFFAMAIIAVMATVMIAESISVFSSSDYFSGEDMRISGVFSSPKGNEEVTIDVYYPNMDFEDLLMANPNEYDKILLYRDEMTMQSNGGYDFSFNVGDIPSGRYTAYISRSGSDEIKCETINYVSPSERQKIIVSTKFGNIYYTNEKPVFYIGVPSGFELENTEIRCTVKTFNGEVVYKKTQNTTAQNCSVVLNDFDLYGVFDFNVELYEKNTFITSDSMTFSVIRKNEKKNPKVAVHELLGNDKVYYSKFNSIMGVFEKTGFSAARTGISRSGAAWSGDVLNYQTEYNKTMQYYSSSGIKPMILLSGSNTSWDHMPTAGPELEDFRKYCIRVAEDTKSYAFAYEIWNEPNLSAFNKDNAPAAQYAELIKIASEAVRSVKPDAKIVAMTTSGCDEAWIKGVIDGAMANGYNIANYIDAVSIHPYWWAEGPEKGQFDAIQRIRTLMNNNSMATKELWVTEVGWQRTIGLDRQAYYTANYLLLNDVKGAADKSFLFRYAAAMPSADNEEFGLLNDGAADVPYSARPVMAAVTNYNRIMNGAEYVSKITTDGIDVYKFKLSDGSDAAVYYSENSNNAVEMDLGVETVTYCDIYGNETTLGSSNGRYCLNRLNGVNYVVGNFTKFESASAVNKIDVLSDTLDEFESKTLTVTAEYDVEVKRSDNVIVSMNNKAGNVSAYSFYVTDFDIEKPFIDILIKNGSNVVCERKIYLKESLENDVVHRIDRYNYQGYSRWNLYNTDYSKDRKNAFRLTAKTDNAVLISDEFSLPDKSGKYKVSFDILADRAREFYFVFAMDSKMNAESVFAGLHTDKDGNIEYYSKRYYQNPINSGITFEPNKWYKIDAVVDLEQKTIVYYIDGQKIGTVTNYPFDTFNWLKFSDSSIEDGTLWLDNIEVRQMNTAPFEIKANNGVLEITANEKSTSFLGDKISAALLYAMYDNNGRLLKADISSLTKNELQNDFGSFKISAYIPDGAKTAKVFLFEDASDLKPLFRVMKKKITAYR